MGFKHVVFLRDCIIYGIKELLINISHFNLLELKHQVEIVFLFVFHKGYTAETGLV